MPCWNIPYQDRFGEHVTVKWANTADEAKELVKKQKSGLGITPTIGTPWLVDPQPFSEESRAKLSARYTQSSPAQPTKNEASASPTTGPVKQ